MLTVVLARANTRNTYRFYSVMLAIHDDSVMLVIHGNRRPLATLCRQLQRSYLWADRFACMSQRA